jgi:hypothetical protein
MLSMSLWFPIESEENRQVRTNSKPLPTCGRCIAKTKNYPFSKPCITSVVTPLTP